MINDILKMITQEIMAFFATVGFAVLFNVNKKELVFCGVSGAFGWLFYQMIVYMVPQAAVPATFAAAVAVSWLSRIISYKRKMPVSVYMIAGIIPLVPGAGLYYTMYEMISNENYKALAKGVETIKLAGVIAVGILAVLSLPQSFFNIGYKKIRGGNRNEKS